MANFPINLNPTEAEKRDLADRLLKRGAYAKPAATLTDLIRAGDKVTILVPNGIGRNGVEWKEKTGRAVMRGPAGWVLNMGGRYGTPGVATEESIVRVVKGRRA